MGKMGMDASDEDVDMTEAPALPTSQKTPSKKSKGKDAETTTDKKKKRKLDAVSDATPTRAADTPASKKSKKVRVEQEPILKAKSEAPAAGVKMTPIAPPVIPDFRHMSSSQAPPASTPSSSRASKAKAQPTPTSKPVEPSSSAVKKESHIPLPPSFTRASSSFSSQPKEDHQDEPVPKANGKVKKERKSKAIKIEHSTEAPKKTTPVPLPNVPVS